MFRKQKILIKIFVIYLFISIEKQYNNYTILTYLLPIILSLLLYINTIYGGFVLDDKHSVTTNKQVKKKNWKYMYKKITIKYFLFFLKI
jgi:hypothetical protein